MNWQARQFPKLGGVAAPLINVAKPPKRAQTGWFLSKTLQQLVLEPPRLLGLLLNLMASQAPLLT